MSRPVSHLFTPADRVVAIHASTEQANAAIDTLGRAGYPSRMLKIVSGHLPAPGGKAARSRRAATQWHTSGTAWGLLWVAFALVAAAIVGRHALPAGAVLMIGATLLAVQTAIVHSSLAPEQVTQASWRGSAPSERPYASELAANRTLLIVEGSRSEIALARSLLGARDVALNDA